MKIGLIVLAVALAATAQSTDANIFSEGASLEAIYKELHSHPELSYQEQETAKLVANELSGAGFDVTSNVGGYGVVGVLRNGAGDTVLVRTEMDALPMIEQTGLEYASKVTTSTDTGAEVGVMHACGHDLHMAVFIGTARMRAEQRENWSGTLVFIAQPA